MSVTRKRSQPPATVKMSTKGSNMPLKPCQGSEAEFHSHSSFLEVLGQYEEFNATSRTRTLSLKLQKGPFERCSFYFTFFSQVELILKY